MQEIRHPDVCPVVSLIRIDRIGTVSPIGNKTDICYLIQRSSGMCNLDLRWLLHSLLPKSHQHTMGAMGGLKLRLKESCGTQEKIYTDSVER